MKIMRIRRPCLAGTALTPSAGWTETLHTGSLVPEQHGAEAKPRPFAWPRRSAAPEETPPADWPADCAHTHKMIFINYFLRLNI